MNVVTTYTHLEEPASNRGRWTRYWPGVTLEARPAGWWAKHARRTKRPGDHTCFEHTYASAEWMMMRKQCFICLHWGWTGQSHGRLNLIMMCRSKSEAAAREHEIKVNYTFRVRWSSMSAGANDSTDPLAPSICYFATAGAVGSDTLTRNLSSTFITHLHFSPWKSRLERLHLTVCWRRTGED